MARSSSRFRTIASAATASLAMLAGTAATTSADIVTLRDGTVYEGTILHQTRRELTIETLVNNVRSTFTIELWKIRSFKEDDATKIDALLAKAGKKNESDDAESANDVGDDAEEAVPASWPEGHAVVLEVPLKGTFGEDIYPKPVAVALEWAIENGVTDIVFRIHSPGGQIWVADKIVEIMKRHQDQLRYHMLIERAISASIWPTFMSDTISIADAGSFGGAVIYTTSDSGSTEVDKKFNGIKAAEIRTLAESNGHSTAIVDAMMLSEAEAYAYRRAGSRGEWKITADAEVAKASGNEWELIDDKENVLTLTTTQAVKYGIAHELPTKDLEALATAVELGPWVDAGSYGIEAYDKWGKKSDDMRDAIMTTFRAMMTEYSIAMSASRLSAANAGVINGKRELAKLRRLLRKSGDLEMETIVDSFEDGLDMDAIYDDLDRRGRDVRRILNGG